LGLEPSRDHVVGGKPSPSAVRCRWPDGAAIAPSDELGADADLPNLQWGSGIGGWDRETLYVVDFSADRLFEVQVGVTDKPRSYP